MKANDEMIKKLKDISASIRTKEYFPFYYLYGNESYLINSIKKSLIKSFVDDTKLNIKIYTKDNFELNEVTKNIGNIPFMNDKKLIIFDNIDYFINAKEDDYTKDLIKVFNDSKDINIVLFFRIENDDKYSKKYNNDNIFFKFFSENGISAELRRLTESELNEKISNYFKKNKVDIDKINIVYFIRLCGNNLNNLYNEADKLISFLGDKKSVDKNDIEQIVTKNIDDKVYNLIDLYNSNKKQEALKYYGDLLVEGEKPGSIFSVFAYNYSNMIVCKDLLQRGKSQMEIADTMGIAPWMAKKIIDANKFVTIDTLKEKMKRITDISLGRVKGYLNEDYMVILLMN